MRRRRLRLAGVAAVVVASTALAASAAPAQRPGSESSLAPAPERVVVTPGARYKAGWLHALVLGKDYRDLWTTPIEVDVLDLSTEAGGLRPTQRGGSAQTNSLRMKGGDGREYVFRPVEKDFSRGLPPELQRTLVRSVAQDQASGYHPAAPLIVSRLLDATGIHHPRPRLVVMPNDPALGEFRADYAGVLGAIEERPGEDFDETEDMPGALEVISSEKLFERMRRNPVNRVDTRSYLAARLFDVLVGDRDRHRDQWRWARFSAGKRTPWEPIPRDRDMPFAKFEGIGPWAARGFNPQLVTFEARYPDMVWLNWNAREIDRLLLSGFERRTWDSVAASLAVRITDAAIDSAIAQMPAPFVVKNGPELRRALIARRDRLPKAASEFYAMLARDVDVNGSDRSDLAEITRDADGGARVAFFAIDSVTGELTDSVPFFDRRFVPGETHEVRLYLHGGNDRILLRGARRGDILVRVIAGGGDDELIDSVSGGDPALRFYDATGRVRAKSRRVIDRAVYTPPPVARPEDPNRDWGTWSYQFRSVSYATGLGVVAGWSWTRLTYGFRSNPFASRSVVRGDFSFGEMRPRLTYSGEFHTPNQNRYTDLELLASGIELIRFHGIGNDTPSDHETSFYRVFQNLFRAEPSVTFRLNPRASASLGIRGQLSATDKDAETLVGETKPYGSGTFGEVGLTAGLAVDRRDLPNAPSKGYRLAIGASAFPPLWSVDRAFGEAHVTASTYARAKAPLEPTLALRVGGQHVWGAFPYHDAAFLGGVSTLRGWDEQRFAGRSSLYGGAELRLFVAKSFVLLPADVGLLGFADAGRVYADVSSDTWHSAVGAGIWLAPLTRNNTVSLSVGWGKERTGVYVRSGFAF